jgi:hypothetical protein
MRTTLSIAAAVVRPRDRVIYPRNQVVGIIESAEDARGILLSLRRGEFLDSEIHLSARDGALIVAVDVAAKPRRQLAVAILARHHARTVN